MALQSEKTKEETRTWSALPADILFAILSLLPYQYHPYFAAVCKCWKSCISPVYPADQCPLLAHFQKWGDGIFRYYSPILNKTFTVDCPFSLAGNTAFFFARDGWLLLYKNSQIILVNPTTGNLHKSPVLDGIHFVNGMAFSGKPPHDCTTFVINSSCTADVQITTWRCGEDSYSSDFHNNNLPFVMSEFSSPVPLGGLFYCLGEKGNLGVYDPNEGTWTVLAGLKQFDASYQESFLVESDGELMSVVVGKLGMPVNVFNLNRTAMTWEVVKSIGSTRTLFIGSRMSLVATTGVRRMGNRVYFSRIQGKPETVHAEIKCTESRIFFIPKSLPSRDSGGEARILEDRMCYYSLDNDELSKYIDSKDQLYCVWFEARLQD